MANMQLGRTVVIANPSSHSGRGANAAERVARFFDAYTNATTTFELVRTTGPGNATELAARAASDGTDTIIALGGDGVIHEVANGLMTVARVKRPRLGVIPMGSGNDFARTIHISHNRPETALAELMAGRVRSFDLGVVRSNSGTTTYFVETLSFGMDAAIALDTTRRRAAGTTKEGEALFATSALRIVSAGGKGFTVNVSFDGEAAPSTRGLMLAVQIGPTYGGGFRVCPTASPLDGRLSTCRNVRNARTPRLLALLGLARLGLHTHSRILELRDCNNMTVSFPDGEPPCQVDGEALCGSSFEVGCVAAALDVIVGAKAPW